MLNFCGPTVHIVLLTSQNSLHFSPEPEPSKLIRPVGLRLPSDAYSMHQNMYEYKIPIYNYI